MNNFRQCGEMYINFDQQNNPEYGFVVDKNVITKFYTLCDRELEKISLPVLSPALRTQSNAVMAQNLIKKQTLDPQDEQALDACHAELIDYAKGGAVIAKGCFASVQKIQIEVPGDYSVRLEPGCFRDWSSIKLILPPEMGVKHMCRTFFSYAYFREHQEKWDLIAHQNFDINNVKNRNNVYTNQSYREQDNCMWFAVEHLPAEKLTTCLINDSETTPVIEPETKDLQQ